MRLIPGLPIFGINLQINKKSLQKLLNLGAKMIYPAHSKHFPTDAIKTVIA